jgi:trans-aconitate methyltransferase
MKVADQIKAVSVYQLKISLKGLIPPIWRKVQVPGQVTLYELHRILQIVMGWGNYHPYRFLIEGAAYGEPDPTETWLKPARETRLNEVVSDEGSKFIYRYDPADDWQHVVKVEKITPPQSGESYPLCLSGQRACPPEECGGIWEYANLLEVLKNPEHPDYQEMLEQYGGQVDSEAFDVVRVNKALRLVWLANLLPPKIALMLRRTPPVANPVTSASDQWTELDSELYQAIAAVAVPARQEQIAALLTLLPFAAVEPFRAVELGCGQGLLSYALLDCFPQATLLALDGSPAMRAQTAQRLKPFGPRAVIEPFDLRATDWLPRLQGVDCVVSSLVIHHLNGVEKRRLFATIGGHLSPRGVLLLADLVEPQRLEARQLFAATWDRAAEAQALANTGSTALFERFIEVGWNYYHFPDPFDQPSPLFEQLTWLKAAGFAVVDCFWLQAGHAIYGGYKAETAPPGSGISFNAALQSAQRAISTPLPSQL